VSRSSVATRKGTHGHGACVPGLRSPNTNRGCRAVRLDRGHLCHGPASRRVPSRAPCTAQPSRFNT
jgi:hypothetical protein